MAKLDLAGQRYGMLQVLEFVGANKRQGRLWRCACDCGREKVTNTSRLRNGQTRSCGCLVRALTTQRNLTHGLRYTPEYVAWRSMRGRCSNLSDQNYKRYGGRGICVCERWERFENFYADVGPRPSAGHSIERVNNELGYSPDNCVWATPLAQANNTRRTRLISHGGRTQSLSAWARESALPLSTIKSRLDHGWTPERALTASIRSQGALR
jgi:hypothetical protein